MSAKQKEEKVIGKFVRDILKSDDFKKQHYGLATELGNRKQDRISTGSVFFDQALGGGFRSGSWARFYGEVECGKTSQGLRWAHNWQQHYPDNGFVLIYNAEGRITEELLERSGIDRNPEKFDMVYGNNYDMIMSSMERIIENNEDNLKFFFMIDSTDACERDIDKKKELGEAEKIAGGAAIQSAAGRRLSLKFFLDGHFLYLTSQLRDKMKTGGSTYGNGPTKAASGGNAQRYYASLTGDIKKPWTGVGGTTIHEDPNKPGESPKIGVMVHIKLEKTPNEKTGEVIQFPVKFGHKGGIWEAYEAFMICENLKHWAREGQGMFKIDPAFEQDLKDSNLTFEPNFRSSAKLRDSFETNPDLVKYVLERFRRNYIVEV